MSHQQHPLGGSRPAWRAWQSPRQPYPRRQGWWWKHAELGDRACTPRTCECSES